MKENRHTKICDNCGFKFRLKKFPTFKKTTYNTKNEKVIYQCIRKTCRKCTWQKRKQNIHYSRKQTL